MLAYNQNDLLYQVSLTMIPGIGPVQARILVEHFGSAAAVFRSDIKELSSIENIGTVRAGKITGFSDFQTAGKQLLFIEKYKIQPLFLTDPAYPQRLLHCNDAPTLLYYKGNANLNNCKVISIIGTRKCSAYGRQITEKLISELAGTNILITSGLALGIDAVAHKAALSNQLATIGVLAHGLDTLYPYEHKTLAREMIENGGLLTEFGQGVEPDKHNFPRRNRIVAGMADATVVIETDVKGGSMITANLAWSYNRELFAIPGKVSDKQSSGCNQLIKNNKAMLLTNAQQLLETMGWETTTNATANELPPPPDLTPDEQIIITICREKELTHIDELQQLSGMDSSTVASAILSLELQGLLSAHAGKMYQLN